MAEAVTRGSPLPEANAAFWQRLDSKWVLIGLPIALVVWLSLVPLVFLLWQSFLTPQTASRPAVFTLENFNTDGVFVNSSTMPGIIWVEGLHYSPMSFLLMTAAFRSMDPSLEESALMSGASILQIAWKITLKLAWPAAAGALLILLVRALESFEVPALLGLPVGIQVYTSAIYQAIHQYPSQIGLAAAYAITLLLITSVGIYFQSRLAYQGAKYSTVTGKGFRPRTVDVGGWRYFTAALFIGHFGIIVLLAFLVLGWSSLRKFFHAPSWGARYPLSVGYSRTI